MNWEVLGELVWNDPNVFGKRNMCYIDIISRRHGWRSIGELVLHQSDAGDVLDCWGEGRKKAQSEVKALELRSNLWVATETKRVHRNAKMVSRLIHA